MNVTPLRHDADVLRVLSFGAGVQSTAVLLMSLYGELPPLDRIVFADTGWEPSAVYEHLERCKREAARHGQTIDIVTAGNIRTDHVAPVRFIERPTVNLASKGKQRHSMPFYVRNGDGSEGMTSRQCTANYKIAPVERFIREAIGLRERQWWPTVHSVDQVLGISLDESQRMRDSRRAAVRNVYPLVDMRMTRGDCIGWMSRHGWTAPRSACIGCPFHDRHAWREIRDHDPVAFADAVAFDAEFRERAAAGLTTLDGAPYLHRARVPLDQVDLGAPDDDDGTLFGAWATECEGMCGT